MRWHRHASSAEVHGGKRDTCGCTRHTKVDGHARAWEKRKHAGNYDYNDDERMVGKHAAIEGHGNGGQARLVLSATGLAYPGFKLWTTVPKQAYLKGWPDVNGEAVQVHAGWR